MADKLYIVGVDPEDERCLRCGSMHLDTGWECTECGYDNFEHYSKPKSSTAQEARNVD